MGFGEKKVQQESLRAAAFAKPGKHEQEDIASQTPPGWEAQKLNL